MKKTAIQQAIDHEKQYLCSMMESGAGQISVEFQKERISFLEKLRDTTEREQIEDAWDDGHLCGFNQNLHVTQKQYYQKTYGNGE